MLRLTSSLVYFLFSFTTQDDHFLIHFFAGALFASIILVTSICSFIASITDNSVYAATLDVFNGFIFITLAGYCGITIISLR